ncbi:MAG: UvrB/UvrC motif-containing protein [Oscillospiraceae bacterium]|nr:UvrB/UvrC motif-containing protein [Oscillospiraceae bacterium]
MKCEKCGKEANFFYSSTVNGRHEEHCYCADCAREAGFENAFRFEPMEMFDGMFGNFFEDFFAPARMLPSFDSFGSPFRAMLRAPGTATAPRRAMSEAESKVPEDAGEEVRARRELEALRQQLREAVEKEDFETAIGLRDRIRELEK